MSAHVSPIVGLSATTKGEVVFVEQSQDDAIRLVAVSEQAAPPGPDQTLARTGYFRISAPC